MASNRMLRIATKFAKNNLFAQKWVRCSHHLHSVNFAQTLSIPETIQSELKNGIRVASEDTGSPTATLGIWIESGTRYETNENNGISNFVEHMIFKGTDKRSQTQLENDIEKMGAVLNSYTGKEHTAFYIKCLASDVPKAAQILGDLIKNPKFDESEISKEREVILREMDEMDTNYQEMVFNYMHSIAFQQTPLALSKVGTTENVKKINRNDLVSYVDTHFKGPRIVLSAAGAVDHKQIVDLANEHFSDIKLVYDKSEIPILKPCRFTGSEIRVRDDSMPLCHVAIAVEAPGYQDPDYLPFLLANQLIGSWDRSHGGGPNSSSYMALASSADNLSHSFQAFNLSYRDTGLWGIYFVSERMKLQPFSWQLQTELRRICTELTDNELNRAKNLLMTNILMQSESSTTIAEDIGRQILNYGKRFSLPEMEAKIASVTAEQVREVCFKYIWDRCPVVTAVGPVENLPSYEELRSKMYWSRY